MMNYLNTKTVNTLKTLQIMINEKYTERWRKKCGYFRQHIDNPNNNSEYLIRVWKKLNIRKQPWMGLIEM